MPGRKTGIAWGAAGLLYLAGSPAPAQQAAQPDTSDIIRKLSLPKPDATDLGGPSRGIRAEAPDEPEAPAATHATVAHVPRVARPVTAAIDLAIPFNTGSDTLAKRSAPIMDALGHALASPDLSGDRFKIEGHADTVGDAAVNQSLSQRRAEKVAAALTQTYGVPADHLSAVGVGSSQLVVPTPDQTAEPRNRVVRVINLGPEQK